MKKCLRYPEVDSLFEEKNHRDTFQIVKINTKKNLENNPKLGLPLKRHVRPNVLKERMKIRLAGLNRFFK